MNLKWLIDDHMNDNNDKLIKILESKHIEYKQVNYYNLIKNGFYYYYPEGDNVVCYGSTIFISMCQRANWNPGIICNFDNFAVSKYTNFVGKDWFLNCEYVLLPFHMLDQMEPELFYMFGVNDAIFIKPDKGTKSMNGEVVFKEEFDKNLKGAWINVPPDELIVVSRPFKISREYRFFVSEDKIITGSLYRMNGILCYENIDNINGEDSKYATLRTECIIKEINESVFADNIDHLYVVDICKTGNDFYVLEFNSASCAGFYDCNVEKIVDRINEIDYNEDGE